MKIALGVTGGIAAYKAAEIVRLLQDRGIRVQVVMTRNAQEFVRPLTFAALSGEKVITGMFSSGEEHEPNIDSAIEHIAVAQSIDALVVVPATADVIAHFAQGIASVAGTDVFIFAMFGFFQVAMGLSLFMLGSRLLPSGQASLIATLETPLMPFWVWLAFQEIPTSRALAGGALVMGAVIADIVADSRAREGPVLQAPHPIDGQ